MAMKSVNTKCKHEKAHLTEADAIYFIILHVNHYFSQHLPSSIETKIVKLNIEVNKLNWIDKGKLEHTHKNRTTYLEYFLIKLSQVWKVFFIYSVIPEKLP